jgi:hypothetical protein
VLDNDDDNDGTSDDDVVEVDTAIDAVAVA